MKAFYIDLILIIGWIVLGVTTLCQEEVSKLSYLTAIICCVCWIGIQAIRDYNDGKNNRPPKTA